MTATDDRSPAGPELVVTTSRRSDGVVLALRGELDIATGPVLDAAVRAAVQDAPAPTRLVLDLAALEFADVAGLGVLLPHQRALAAGGGSVVLQGASPMVRRIVTTLDLGDRLQLGP